MDTTTTATERAAELRRKIAELTTRKEKTDSDLASVHAAHRQAAEKRAAVIELLASAPEKESVRLHRQLDELDEQIRIVQRRAESLEVVLQKIGREAGALNAELAEAEGLIREQERAKALEAFQAKLKHASRSAEEALANARESLATLNRLGAQGVEAFGDAALRICNPVFEEFVLREANLDRGGWRQAFPAYTNLQFWVRPMTRG